MGQEAEWAQENHRISMARLCDAGLEHLTQAWPAHLAGVRRPVLDHLSPGELGARIGRGISSTFWTLTYVEQLNRPGNLTC